MRQSLPLLLVAALAAATPANAQYVFLDTNGDGACDAADNLPPGDSSVDVWLDTNHNADGSTATCATGEALSISGYDVVLAAGVAGSAVLTFGSWSNAVVAFSQQIGVASEGPYFRAAFSAPSGFLPAGKYKLGTLGYTGSGTGCAVLTPTPIGTISGTPYYTSFSSECLGSNQDNVLRFGVDFTDFCAAGGICDAAADPTRTTWGKIKERYMH
ncbi:MAG TPA: hypothetical protein VF363_08115 [Candidatus Eisenbacteria bacterium]